MQRILSYLEQDNLWEVYQGEIAAGTVPWAWAQNQVPLQVFACPSDPNSPNVLWTRGLRGNYLVVHGGHSLKAGDNDDSANGMFYVRSETRIADVTDGTSNTAMVGEINTVADTTDRRGAYFITGFNSANVTLALRDTPNSPLPDQANAPTIVDDPPWAPGQASTEWMRTNARSHHPGGANFCFADGSVRFLTDTIDLDTYRNIGDRNDGNVLGDF